ncbi:hypothetical protein F5X68DRAFT_26876 [Plectosphaerella plurivora]|uniref:Uncharacterized protein n=1 Tax=Plectosphaerella plurivora TaxID=936078 RepID=A0A9P9A836_9PEZI|nr:hypothetical protein F5X68DRAFT_26876 [Plectosphaerella plurivora]
MTGKSNNTTSGQQIEKQRSCMYYGGSDVPHGSWVYVHRRPLLLLSHPPYCSHPLTRPRCLPLSCCFHRPGRHAGPGDTRSMDRPATLPSHWMNINREKKKKEAENKKPGASGTSPARRRGRVWATSPVSDGRDGHPEMGAAFGSSTQHVHPTSNGMNACVLHAGTDDKKRGALSTDCVMRPEMWERRLPLEMWGKLLRLLLNKK